MNKPFGIAIDGDGVAWITSNGNDSIVAISQDGSLLDVFSNQGSEANFKLPMGIAVDSFGNKWVSNSDAVATPCAGDTGKQLISEEAANAKTPPDFASIALIRKGGKVDIFTGGGVFIPWGIAVDGNDNIFVANFGSPKVSPPGQSPVYKPVGLVQLCGAKTENCPPGYQTGDGISPESGYTSNDLTRITGLQIDPSGNVWMVNNWVLDALSNQENPGGHQLVVFVGLAAPIITPMAGPPRQP